MCKMDALPIELTCFLGFKLIYGYKNVLFPYCCRLTLIYPTLIIG